MCLEVREALKRRNIATREEQDSRADEWTSTSAEYVSTEEDEGEVEGSGDDMA